MKNTKVLSAMIVTVTFFFVLMIHQSYVTSNHKHKVFGVTYMTMNNPFYEVINSEIRKVVDAHGDQLITLDPALNADKQNEQIDDLIAQKVDGIFVNPIDPDRIQPALAAAKAANIPIIVVDAPIVASQLADCTVISDNYDAGVQCAEDMMGRMESARIVLLEHSVAKSAKERIRGFLETIENSPQYQVVNRKECEGQLELAMPAMQEILDETENIDVVIALNDPSALGALAALQANHQTQVLVYGIDGTPDMKVLIGRTPMVAGTVAQSPVTIGEIAVEKMYQLIAGEAVESEIVIPVNLITSDNISQYDQKGWQ